MTRHAEELANITYVLNLLPRYEIIE